MVIAGESALAEELRAAAEQAGYEVRSPHAPTRRCAAGVGASTATRPPRRSERALRRAGRTAAARRPPQGGARLVLCARGSLAALDPGGSAVGFHVVAPLAQAGLVELTRSESSSPVAAARAERFFATLGKHVRGWATHRAWCSGRIVCQVINESAFALGEGVGSAARHRHGHGAGAEPPARAAGVGGSDRPGPRAGVLEALCDEYQQL